MGILPIKLHDDLIEKIDALVEAKRFKNRSDAIRQILQQYLERESIHTLPSSEQLKKISHVVDLMLTKKKPVFDIKTEKTAAELIAEGRER